jgi:uracil-DNA glycosylase
MQGTWLDKLRDEFEQPYMQNLKAFLTEEKQAQHIVYPHSSDTFNAYNTTRFEDVKVVILGQDPYHGPDQAHGLSFSVREGIKNPPSLVNIFKEIHQDLGISFSGRGNLTPWANQGVFLLNATLSVRQAAAGSHQKKGWETFTDKTIQLLNEERENIVFLLWGSYAQKKGAFIDEDKHLVLKAPHPSPLSAHRGFLGCGHFSKTNAYLKSKGIQEIDWQI